MRLLLINPHENNIVRTSSPMAVEKHTGLFPPLNLLYIASFINATKRHRAEVLDMLTDGIGALSARLHRLNPEAVGIGTTSFNLLSALDVAHAVKTFNPAIKVIMGGPHATVYPMETASYENIDYAVMGEGEKTALRLLDALDVAAGFEDIPPGVAFKTKSGVINTGPVLLIDDLDTLPFPDRELISYRNHFNILSEKYPSTTMFSGRGCCYDCSFCYHSFGRGVRLRSAENVADEMEYVKRLGIKDIYFVDDAFTASRKRIFKLCSELLRRHLGLDWAVRGRVDSVDIELLKYMKAAGCRRIHYGVESANQEVLDRWDKKITPESVRLAFSWSRQAGIQTGAELILAGPGESYKKISNTINFALELDPDFAFFNILTPYPGTRLYQEGINSGVFKDDYWRDFASAPSPKVHIRYWDEILREMELESLLKKAHFKFYFRPRYILKSLFKTQNLVSMAKKVKMALGMGVYTLSK